MSLRRPLMMLTFNRRRSLLVKILLIVPVTWLIVSTIVTLHDSKNSDYETKEEEEEQMQPVPVLVDPIHVEEAVQTYEGRKPRQSTEDLQPPVVISHEVHRDSHQDLAVLPMPGEMSGPGEMGKAVVLSNLTEEQKKMVKEGWDKNAFNQYISDLISLHRKLPDVRTKGCEDEVYQVQTLPETSVIICFHNEAWSVLLRTVISVIDRSPPHLLKEVILVDDDSDMPHLGQPLEDYFASQPKVKFLRAKRREGLIRARLMGASISTAPVLTYLDSHCECAHGWLEPLLQRIANNWTTVVCPVMSGLPR